MWKFGEKAVLATKTKTSKDKTFVVIDKDDRTSTKAKAKLQKAIKDAKNKGIYFIYSIPSIEF